MSTSDNEQVDNQAELDSRTGEFDWDLKAAKYPDQIVEKEITNESLPDITISGCSTPKFEPSKHDFTRGIGPATPRPGTPNNETFLTSRSLFEDQDPPMITFCNLPEITPNYGTECDLVNTQAPADLLPQISSVSSCANPEISTPCVQKPKEVEVQKEPPKPKRVIPIRGRVASGIPKKNENNLQSNSSIPVKVSVSRPPSKVSIKPSKTGSLYKSQLRTPRAPTNKHTLEVQFMNKHKRLLQYKKDLLDKQRPIMDLYQNLQEIKRQLAEFGKVVEIEEIKLVSMDEPKKRDHPCGDVLSQEIVQHMKSSIEDIPKALMGICQNLVSRRAAIVDLLENVSQSNFDSLELADKIDTLKNEGNDLKQSLDVMITQSEERITELIKNWYSLLENKSQECSSLKLEEVEEQMKQKDAMLQESKQVILDLQRKLEDRRNLHERAISECENTVKEYTENIRKLTLELESERRNAGDIKSRNSTNSQTIKSLRQKLNDSEVKLKEAENKNADISKKLRLTQDQQRQKENNWTKEKDEMQKNIKEQEKLLRKLTEDRNSFQTRLENTENKRKSEEYNLKREVDELNTKLKDLVEQLDRSQNEKTEFKGKYEKLEEELRRLGVEHQKEMQAISNQMDWGKTIPCPDAQAELYSELLATKVTLREYEEKIKNFEKDNAKWATERQDLIDKLGIIHVGPDIRRQEEIINRYKNLLQDSELRLNEKSVEVAKLNAELKHLKIRQDALEEQNLNCPTEELRKMVVDGRQKLSEIMKKSMENEQKLACYENTIEKQHKQMNEMENLLRVRDGLIGMIKAKKDELLMEKDSLTRYCKDVRNMLAETREDLRVKSEVIRDLQDKLERKDKTVVVLEKKITELEENLAYTNEKRFKLQDTIGTMEKELQSTKAQANQMADLHQSRYDLGMIHSKNVNLKMSSQNPTFESLTFRHRQSSEFNLDLPIREVDCIRRRLYKLSNFQLPVSLNGISNGKNSEGEGSSKSTCNSLHSTKSLYTFTNKNAYQKMIELESKRYEILQKQTDASYENLSNLLRLSLPPESPVRDRNDTEMSETASLMTTGSNFTSDTNRLVSVSSNKTFGLTPKLDFNKIYLAHLSETYKDLNDSLTKIKNSLTSEVDERENFNAD